MKTILLLIHILSFINMDVQKPSPKDVKKVESLIDSAYDKTLKVDMKSSCLFAKKALELSKKKGYKKGEAWSNFYLAQGLCDLWAYKQSLIYLKNSEDVNQEINDKFLTFEIHRVRSRVFASMELLKASIKEQEKGLNIINQIPRNAQEKDYLKSLAYENLAVSFSMINKNDSFYEYLSKNKELLEKQDPDFVYRNLISLYAMLGAYYTDQHEFDKAKLYFTKSEKIAEKYKFPSISFTYQRWGDMEMERKNPHTALKFYEKSLDILKKTNFKSEIPIIYKKISKAYLQLGNNQLEKDFKLKALELQNELKTEQLRSSSSAVEEIFKIELEDVNSKNSESRIILLLTISLVILALITAYIKYNQARKKRTAEENNKLLLNKEKEINMLTTKVNESFDHIVQLAKTNSPEFFTRFQEVYPRFSENLLKASPNLTKTELTFCAYTYLGFTTKEVALYTFKANKSVENIRYYIRKKLDLTPGQDFTIVIREIADRTNY